MVRGDILDHICSRVITKAATAPHFVGVLHAIVRECPQPMLEHLAKVGVFFFFFFPLPLNFLSTCCNRSKT